MASEQSIIDLYRRDFSIDGIAERCGTTPEAVLAVIADHGFRPPSAADKRRATALQVLRDGGNIAQAVLASGLNEQTVKKLRRLHHIRPAGEPEPSHHPDAWKPSAGAEEVLGELGVNLDTLPLRPACSERDTALLEALFSDGVTLEVAGALHGLTRQRAHQILHAHTGINASALHRRRREQDLLLQEQKSRDVAAAFAQAHPEATVNQIAHVSGMTRSGVFDLLGDDAYPRLDGHEWAGPTVTDYDIVEELRRVAALTGGTPLTGKFFEENKADGFIGRVRIVQRFGTWRNACDAAGVQSNAPSRPSYKRTWGRDQLLDFADQYLAEVGPSGTYAGFTTWLQDHKRTGAPSSQTIRNALGSWHHIIELVLSRRNAA